MKLTNEEIKRLIFEADETDAKEKTNKQPEDSEGDIEDDPDDKPKQQTADNTEKKSEKKSEKTSDNQKQPESKKNANQEIFNNNVDNKDDDRSNDSKNSEKTSGDIKSELKNDGWEIRNEDDITYFLKHTDNSNVFYILNFSKLFNESKFLAKIRELILEEDTTNNTCILELVNTDTGIAYGPFTLRTSDNYVELKKAIAEKAKEVVDSNWSEEFADKELANVSEMTKLLASAYNKQKTDDSVDSENEDKPADTDKENLDNKEDQSTDGEKQEEHSEKYIVDKINEAFSKLTEDEQNAFEVIYGDKLINKIQGK